MFQIDNTLVSEEIITKDFVCNLNACKGSCCVEGEAGAPDAPAPAVDFKLFEWALGTILSRSFDFQLSSPMAIWGQEPGGHRVIVPVADFFNHHHTSTAQIKRSHNYNTNALQHDTAPNSLSICFCWHRGIRQGKV